MREYDKHQVVSRVQRARRIPGTHPAPRVYRVSENKFQYRVGPGIQMVKCSFGSVWATLTSPEGKTQRVKLET